jgi:hypothetical protein
MTDTAQGAASPSTVAIAFSGGLGVAACHAGVFEAFACANGGAGVPGHPREAACALVRGKRTRSIARDLSRRVAVLGCFFAQIIDDACSSVTRQQFTRFVRDAGLLAQALDLESLLVGHGITVRVQGHGCVLLALNE